MPDYIAFLRAINVGGHNVKMDSLRQLFENLGFNNVETFIASGNVVFGAEEGDTRKLEERIAQNLEAALGYRVAVFIRTRAELAAISRYEPFPPNVLAAAQALNVAFMADSLDWEAEQKLMALKTDIDDFHAHQREVFWLCRKKQSESTFSNVMFERKLSRQATFRGISTIRKMAEKYSASD